MGTLLRPAGESASDNAPTCRGQQATHARYAARSLPKTSPPHGESLNRIMADKPQSIARRRLRVIVGVAAGIGLAALAWPAAGPEVPEATAGAQRFVWNRDSLWAGLEASFAQSRAQGCPNENACRRRGFARRRARRTAGGAHNRRRSVPRLAGTPFFRLAPRAAACGALANEYVELQGRLRDATKWQSTEWDLDGPSKCGTGCTDCMYGTRAAVEEVMLQHQDSVRAALRWVAPFRRRRRQPSPTASGFTRATYSSLAVATPPRRSSRAAMTIRGNFSHIAFVHVDSANRAISVIEAHIESGVVVATADKYIADKKLRVMVLRLRPDLPALAARPHAPSPRGEQHARTRTHRAHSVRLHDGLRRCFTAVLFRSRIGCVSRTWSHALDWNLDDLRAPGSSSLARLVRRQAVRDAGAVGPGV